MARKKLNKILAWTLAATMAVSPVNLTWASESTDLFSDSSENAESVEASVGEDDSSQQEEQGTIVSAGEENDSPFIAEDSAEAFSAGENSDNVDTSGVLRITEEGTFDVKTGEQFIFAPEEAATYRISTGKDYSIDIEPSESRNVIDDTYYTIKTEAGHAYPFYVKADTDDSVVTTVTIEKVSAIKSISVAEDWNQSVTYPAEKVLDDEIDGNLPVTLQLEDESQATGTYVHEVAGYGSIGIVYEDSNHNLIWNDGNPNNGSKRPTTPGTYTYHFYCVADPGIISKPYTMVLKSFDELFSSNTVSKSGDSLSVAFNSNAYVKNINYSQLKYNYGFKFRADKNMTYYADFDGALYIHSWDQEGHQDVSSYFEPDNFTLQAGREYYFIWETDEPIEAGSNPWVIEPAGDSITSIEWVNQPSNIFIEEFEKYIGFSNFGVSVKVTDGDGTSEIIQWCEESKKYGRLKCSDERDNKGNISLHYSLSKNPSARIDFSAQRKSLKDVKNNIPEMKVDQSISLERNFNNNYILKFTAPKSGGYKFEITGTELADMWDDYTKCIIENKEGTIISSDYYNKDEVLSLDEGCTAYIITDIYDGTISAKVSEKNVIHNICLTNTDELPVLYKEFLQSIESSEAVEAYLKNAKFKIDFSNGTSQIHQFGDMLEDFGEFHVDSFGYNEESEQYEINVCFTNDEDPYEVKNPIVLSTISTLTEPENGIGGISNNVSSAKSYKFSGSNRVQYFYIENVLNSPQVFNLQFTGHTNDAERTVLTATLNGDIWSCQEMNLGIDSDENYAGISVTLNPGSKMYLEYGGDAASVELISNDIKINKIELLPYSNQIFKDADLCNTLKDLNFKIEYELNGKRDSTTIEQYERDENLHFSLDVLFDGKSISPKGLSIGNHTVTCRIPEVSSEYKEAGTLQVLSYKDLFTSPSTVGNTITFDRTKTFRQKNYVGFNIEKAGFYRVTLIPDDNYSSKVTDITNDYQFIATDINGFQQMAGYGTISLYGGYHYFDKGLLMIFANGAVNVTVSKEVLDDLKNLYKECQKYDQNIFTEESWEDFSEAMTIAKNFLNNSSSNQGSYELTQILNLLISARDELREKPSIDFSKDPQFEWKEISDENPATIEGYGTVPKFNATATFYCRQDGEYNIGKDCDVSWRDVMGTDGSLSLLYTASVEVDGKTFTDTKTIWLNKVDENSNRIFAETDVKPGAPDVMVMGLNKELIESFLSDTEKSSYNDNAIPTDIKISTEIKDITETVDSADASKATEELNKITGSMSESPNNTNIEYLDISMFKNVKIGQGSVAKDQITDTGKNVIIKLELSKEAQNVAPGYTRSFYIIRIHEGVATRLDAKRTGNYLSFETNLFSTYALAYVDVKNSISVPSYPSYPVTDITLSQDKICLTKAGETLQLTATVVPSYADNKTVIWKSNDEKIATVDKDGKVTAVANGTVTITATSADGNHSAAVTVTVKISSEKLTLTAEKKTLTKVGDSLQIVAKVEPDNAYDKLIWKSGDEKVAIVDDNGKVTAVAAGQAVITATTEDEKLSESFTVTVKISDVPSVNATTAYGNLKARSVTQTNNSIKIEWSRISGADGYIVYGSRCNNNGNVYKYKRLATITNGKTRTWTHTKLKKATYYKYVVKAYKLVNGKKIITDISVTVHAVTKGGNYGVAKAVSISKIGNKKNVTKVTLKKGKTAQITAVEIKKDKKIKRHRNLCYESSNTHIATVTSKGIIKATGKGQCTVWVYAQNGVSKAITVTVK